MEKFDIYCKLANDSSLYEKMSKRFNESDKLKLTAIIYETGYDILSDATELTTYPYVRNFVNEIEGGLSKRRIVCVTGPRKSGKTVGLRQLSATLNYARYFSAKELSEEESYDLLDDMKHSIEIDEEIVYLLDEVTHFSRTNEVLEDLAICMCDHPNHTKTKFVLTGSQSYAVQYWCGRHFCNNYTTVNVNFLGYDEWLQYKSEDCNEQTFINYLRYIPSFYNMGLAHDYIRDCLYETIEAETNAVTSIREMDVEDITADMIMSVLFATLVSLHNSISLTKFNDSNSLYSAIRFYYKGKLPNLKEVLIDKLSTIVSKSYSILNNIDNEQFYKAILFLKTNNLVTLTPLGSYKTLPDVYHFDGKNYKSTILRDFNICIKHPAFYISIIQQIFNEENVDIPVLLLGSIVECYVRGILPNDYAYEYRSDKTEIDYVNDVERLAVEISISNTHDTHFAVLPDDYKKILLTKTIHDESGYIKKIPYTYGDV